MNNSDCCCSINALIGVNHLLDRCTNVVESFEFQLNSE